MVSILQLGLIGKWIARDSNVTRAGKKRDEMGVVSDGKVLFPDSNSG
jgi:hypothetical protein